MGVINAIAPDVKGFEVGQRVNILAPDNESESGYAADFNIVAREKLLPAVLAMPVSTLCPCRHHHCQAGDYRPLAPRRVQEALNRENPLWGAPRIYGELQMLGFTVCQSTVAKYMIRRQGLPSLTWRDFLKYQTNGIFALDLFTVPTIRFDILYALVILAHGSRKILHIAITRHPTSDWVTRQIIEAFPWDNAPKYLLRDNDVVYGQRFREQLRAMHIEDIRTAYHSPWQNAYVERVIGSIRRECLDHTIIWNVRHLRRTLKPYAEYYNADRTHLSRGKNTPEGRDLQTDGGNIIAIPKVNGLHHRYQRENV